MILAETNSSRRLDDAGSMRALFAAFRSLLVQTACNLFGMNYHLLRHLSYNLFQLTSPSYPSRPHIVYIRKPLPLLSGRSIFLPRFSFAPAPFCCLTRIYCTLYLSPRTKPSPSPGRSLFLRDSSTRRLRSQPVVSCLVRTASCLSLSCLLVPSSRATLRLLIIESVLPTRCHQKSPKSPLLRCDLPPLVALTLPRLLCGPRAHSAERVWLRIRLLLQVDDTEQAPADLGRDTRPWDWTSSQLAATRKLAPNPLVRFAAANLRSGT